MFIPNRWSLGLVGVSVSWVWSVSWPEIWPPGANHTFVTFEESWGLTGRRDDFGIDNTVHTREKVNMDTQNDGLEEKTPSRNGQFLVSMLDFWSVHLVKTNIQTRYRSIWHFHHEFLSNIFIKLCRAPIIIHHDHMLQLSPYDVGLFPRGD